MEVIVLCITVGFLLAASFVMIGVIIAHASEGMDKRKLRNNNNSSVLSDRADSNPDSSVGDVHESVDYGQNLELNDEAEEAIIRLYSIRAGATRSECDAINYAIECINLRVRLETLFEERGI